MMIKEAYSFDDLLIVPQYSAIIPHETDIAVKLTKNIQLYIPFISAAMDTVTEVAMAVQMALLGGIGVVHKNLSIDKQCALVRSVKTHPFNIKEFSTACVDKKNRLRVLAAVGTGEGEIERAISLIAAECDAIVIDTSHGHSKNVINTLQNIKNSNPKTEIIVGNIVTKEAAVELINAGADALKVGIGAGSICTTRVVSGVGMPQLSAIFDICSLRKDIPDLHVISDGGIKYSGDVAKAIAAGADCVMLGSLLAGTAESTGEIIVSDGAKYKQYRGMGSISAMKSGSADRYFQTTSANLVPQGVEGYVPYKGPVSEILHQLSGGLRSAMGYTGNCTIKDMQTKCKFAKVTSSGIKEGHVHSLSSFDKTSNYYGAQ